MSYPYQQYAAQQGRSLLPGLPGGFTPFPPMPGGSGPLPSPAPLPGPGGSSGPGFYPQPPQGGGTGGAPQAPPPSFVPPKPMQQLYAVDPGGIANCLYRYVYIWQMNGQAYWMYLTFVGPRSIAGYRWVGFGPLGYWAYMGLDLQQVEQFYCY